MKGGKLNKRMPAAVWAEIREGIRARGVCVCACEERTGAACMVRASACCMSARTERHARTRLLAPAQQRVRVPIDLRIVPAPAFLA